MTGSDALAGGEVAEAEDESLEAGRAAGDLLDPRQRLGLLDEDLEADAARFEPELGLELAEQRFDEPHVAWCLDLGDDDDVDRRARRR